MGKSARSRILPAVSRGITGLTPLMRGALVAVAALVLVGAVGVSVLTQASTEPPTPIAGRGATPAGPDPQAPAVAGSEVQDPAEEMTPVDPNRLPPRTPAEPRIHAPLPASAAETGALVDGYPADFAGPREGSTVLSSAVTSEEDTLQFTLRARVDLSPDDLRRGYADQWGTDGLTALASGAAQVSFADAFSSVTVSTQETGTGTVYAITGVLRAG
jgi:hypothetical protein